MSTSAVIVVSAPEGATTIAAYDRLLGPGWSVDDDHCWQVGGTRLVVRAGPAEATLLIPAIDIVGECDEVFDTAVTLLGRRSIRVSPAGRIGAARTGVAPGLPIGIVDSASLDRGVQPTPLSTIARIDHVVMRGPSRDGLLALFGAGLGFDFRLEQQFTLRSEEPVHQLFFRGAGTVVEALVAPEPPQVGLWGLAWTSTNPAADHARLQEAGATLSDIRDGHKPGTRVFTVRGADLVVPTIVIGHEGKS